MDIDLTLTTFGWLALVSRPFHVSHSGAAARDNERWELGAPPAGNPNFAYAQHASTKLLLADAGLGQHEQEYE